MRSEVGQEASGEERNYQHVDDVHLSRHSCRAIRKTVAFGEKADPWVMILCGISGTFMRGHPASRTNTLGDSPNGFLEQSRQRQIPPSHCRWVCELVK